MYFYPNVYSLRLVKHRVIFFNYVYIYKNYSNFKIICLFDSLKVPIAQWEFGWPTLTPTDLQDKTEAKVD